MKDMKGIKLNENGKYIELQNVITKKAGKPLLKSKESNEFSKGKNY